MAGMAMILKRRGKEYLTKAQWINLYTLTLGDCTK